MAKAKKSSISYLPVIAGVIAVVAVILYAVLPMVSYKSTGFGITTTFSLSGFGMIFGSEELAYTSIASTAKSSTELELTTEVAFNTMAFIAFLLVAIGAVLALATPFVKALSSNKLVAIIVGALMLVGGILMFTSKGAAMTALDVNENLVEYYSLGIGAIIGGILAIIAGLATAASGLLKK